MTNYKVIVLKKAEKERRTLPPKDQKRVLQALISLETDPFRGKKLHGDFLGAWAIRVWPYRIIYTIDRSIVTVTVFGIGHRQGVYK